MMLRISRRYRSQNESDRLVASTILKTFFTIENIGCGNGKRKMRRLGWISISGSARLAPTMPSRQVSAVLAGSAESVLRRKTYLEHHRTGSES